MRGKGGKKKIKICPFIHRGKEKRGRLEGEGESEWEGGDIVVNGKKERGVEEDGEAGGIFIFKTL